MALVHKSENDGSVYTNNIEGFWSHFRRMITGCYHDVSDEHLQPYIDEACFRWNTRKMAESERFSQMLHTSIGLVKPNREFVLFSRCVVFCPLEQTPNPNHNQHEQFYPTLAYHLVYT